MIICWPTSKSPDIRPQKKTPQDYEQGQDRTVLECSWGSREKRCNKSAGESECGSVFWWQWTVVCKQPLTRAPLSMEFSSQEYRSGLPFPPPGDLPDLGIKPRSSPALQADFFFFFFNRLSHQWRELRLFFFPLWQYCSACGILVPRAGIKQSPAAVRGQSPNHWTTREFPSSFNFLKNAFHQCSVIFFFLSYYTC